MASVPSIASEQACDACRRQKKKCDQAGPCSRCARLKLTCVGAGRKRFLFKEHKPCRSKNPSDASLQPTPPRPKCLTPSSMPSDELSLLVAAFLDTIKPSTPVRYNLADTLGPFLQLLPQRLGQNRALDAATRALIATHADVCKGKPGNTETSKLYSQGLATLRLGLCIPAEAHSIETICAVLLLTFCAKFGAFGGQHWTSHCNGAVQLLRLRGSHNLSDEFEVKVLQSLRGSVICEVLFNRETLTDASKWHDLETLLFPGEIDLDWQHPITVLGQIPRFIQRSRCLGYGDSIEDEIFRRHIEASYGIMRRSESLLLLRKLANDPDPALHRTARYACTLSVCCILNCMVRTFRFDKSLILREAEELVDASLVLADEMAAFRPLRATFISLNLYAAWICTTVPFKRERLEQAMWEFAGDFEYVKPIHRPHILRVLEGLSADIHLKEVPCSPAVDTIALGSQAAALTTC